MNDLRRQSYFQSVPFLYQRLLIVDIRRPVHFVTHLFRERFVPYSAGRAGAAIDLAAAVWEKDLTNPIRKVIIFTKVYILGGLTGGRFGHAN